MVYKGILRELGKSETIHAEGGYWTHNMGITRYHKKRDQQEGWWHYSYVKIGDTQIRKVIVHPEWNDLLTEAVGQEVELSIGGKLDKPNKRHTVWAMRTPGAGLVKTSVAQQTAGTLMAIFGSVIKALVYGAFVTLFTWLVLGRIIGAVIGSSGTGAIIGFVLGLVFIPYYLVSSFRRIYTVNRQRTALN